MIVTDIGMRWTQQRRACGRDGRAGSLSTKPYRRCNGLLGYIIHARGMSSA